MPHSHKDHCQHNHCFHSIATECTFKVIFSVRIDFIFYVMALNPSENKPIELPSSTSAWDILNKEDSNRSSIINSKLKKASNCSASGRSSSLLSFEGSSSSLRPLAFLTWAVGRGIGQKACRSQSFFNLRISRKFISSWFDLLVDSARGKGSDSMALLDLLLSEPDSMTLLYLLSAERSEFNLARHCFAAIQAAKVEAASTVTSFPVISKTSSGVDSLRALTIAFAPLILQVCPRECYERERERVRERQRLERQSSREPEKMEDEQLWGGVEGLRGRNGGEKRKTPSNHSGKQERGVVMGVVDSEKKRYNICILKSRREREGWLAMVEALHKLDVNLDNKEQKQEEMVSGRPFAEMVKGSWNNDPDLLRVEVKGEEISRNLSRLDHCLIGSWNPSFARGEDLERLGWLMASSWGSKGKLGLASLGKGRVLLEFEFLKEAKRVLISGKRLMRGVQLGLERWSLRSGCLEEGELRNEVWVRILGLPISLWSRQY
ncbi:hypothetical protein CK203_094837 [Vitis vinifera]|uniref:DUF4283 domain-containing protein n=1 Tax=Vitis vinifera TaxID=29760 RepID=A0A438DCG2_VITVI|nr:hypothetical protein CK203_094837 [Vitis vinifera]